jgi:hypothetical protein
MKIKMILFTVLASLLVSGAEKSAASSYPPDDVKVVGVLNYGQKSGPVEYSETPRYRAFLFAGQGDDQVDVRVSGAAANAFIALADQGLNVIATGAGHLSASLPNHGPDAEMYYVVFKGSMNRTARISVQVNKTGGAEAATTATR